MKPDLAFHRTNATGFVGARRSFASKHLLYRRLPSTTLLVLRHLQNSRRRSVGNRTVECAPIREVKLPSKKFERLRRHLPLPFPHKHQWAQIVANLGVYDFP